MSEFSDIFSLVPNKKPAMITVIFSGLIKMTLYIMYRVIMNVRSILLIFS